MSGNLNESELKSEDSKKSKKKALTISSTLTEKIHFLQKIEELEDHLGQYEDFNRYDSAIDVVNDLPNLKKFFQQGLSLIEEIEK